MMRTPRKLHRLFFIIVTLMLSCACCIGAYAQNLDATVQDAANAFMHDPHHVGLSIGVIQNGARHTWHFGSVDRSAQQTPNDHSIYEIGSITKADTGILLAQALIDGKIDLTDDVQKYLPEPYPNLSYLGYPIRILDLATHTSGLPKHIRAFGKGMTEKQFIDSYGNYSEAQFLHDLKTVQIKEFPGTRFEYSNVGAQLIGIILERVYKTSYADLLAKYVTHPNDMPDTVLTLTDAQRARMVKEYDGKGQTMPELAMWRSIPAAGALKSTLADQLNFLQWNLDEFNPAVALSHRALFAETGERGDAIGLFWFAHVLDDGGRLIRHAGGSFGSTSYIVAYPDAHFGVVILANDADASTEKALVQMADKLYAEFSKKN